MSLLPSSRIPLGTKFKSYGIMFKALLRSIVKRDEPMPRPEISIAAIGGAFSDKLAETSPGEMAEDLSAKNV